MPIEFTCTCGKQFKVADEYAGKRSKCTACGKMVTVPTPPPAPAPISEDDDAALLALTEDESSPIQRMPGGYSGKRPGAASPGAAPAAARQSSDPPPEDSVSAASRALTHQSALDKASRSKLRGKGKGKGKEGAKPPKEGVRFQLSWLRIGIGLFLIAGGALWLWLGMTGKLGSIKKFPTVVPSLVIVGGVGTLVSGFIGYVKKSALLEE